MSTKGISEDEARAQQASSFDYPETDLRVKLPRDYNPPMMRFPSHLPGLKGATLLLGFLYVVWMGMEGDLRRVTLLAIVTSLVLVAYLALRLLGGHTYSLRSGLGLAAVLGLAAGAGSVLLTIALMAVKTGLHAHGPEFSRAELLQVINRLPWWSAAGALAGLGLGFLVAGWRRGDKT